MRIENLGTPGERIRRERPDIIREFADRYRLKTRVCAEDGTTVIPGRWGHVYEYSDDRLGVLIMPNPPRRRYWGVTRAKLIGTGLMVIQDGDTEGAAAFDADAPKQVTAAIRAAGIKRKRRLSPEQREQRIAFLRTRSAAALSDAGVCA